MSRERPVVSTCEYSAAPWSGELGVRSEVALPRGLEPLSPP